MCILLILIVEIFDFYIQYNFNGPCFNYYSLLEPDYATGAHPRVRRDTGDHPVFPRVSNPIICLSTGDMIIFALAINHTGTTNLL